MSVHEINDCHARIGNNGPSGPRNGPATMYLPVKFGLSYKDNMYVFVSVKFKNIIQIFAQTKPQSKSTG